MTALIFLTIAPVAIVALALCMRSADMLSRAAAVLLWAQTGIAIATMFPYLAGGHEPAVWGPFRLDGIAALFLVLNTLVVTAALTHAVGFFQREGLSQHPPGRHSVREFYLFAALFLLSMYAVVAADNLGILWIAVEATTLLSAPLVYFHRSHTSLEATWKYLIICSVGIAFAFLGTATLYAGSQRVPLFGDGTLSFSVLSQHAALLPHGLLRLGFVFALLGYGTKAGLFPLHAWLPDAHSEAPAPASAILSGALLNCALVALWRICNLMFGAGQRTFVEATLLPLGVATVLAASLLMLRQRDLKRLLAYSSMENVGLMAIAIALGTGPGFGLQAINHSLVKVALFLLAGNLLQRYGTKSLRDLRGVLTGQPAQGALLLLAAVAVAGTPPFGSFLSEWKILAVAADGRHAATVAATSIGLAVAFIALCVQMGGIVFGEARPADAKPTSPTGAGLTAIPAAMTVAALLLGVMLPAAALIEGFFR